MTSLAIYFSPFILVCVSPSFHIQNTKIFCNNNYLIIVDNSIIFVIFYIICSDLIASYLCAWQLLFIAMYIWSMTTQITVWQVTSNLYLGEKTNVTEVILYSNDISRLSSTCFIFQYNTIW